MLWSYLVWRTLISEEDRKFGTLAFMWTMDVILASIIAWLIQS